jgi:transposase
MNTNKLRTYTVEFKKESINLALNSEQSVIQTARDLGLNGSTLHGWIKKYGSQNNKATLESKPNIELENNRLKKELLIAQQERDILKKAIACFTK